MAGKIRKSRKASARFDPMARTPAAPGADQEIEAPRQLSAHQQRHLERKRLQAEAEALKNKRRKVSKANKLEHKKQKKAISRELKTLKQVSKQAASNSKSACGTADAANASPASLKDFTFVLPTPQRMDEG
uniref:Uncharacterized protein n=1 Tax=Chrysotila carterae TaxID=13221 RepID=A0A7S4B2G7_CHRCT|mmetsp:Transcript_27229/g.59783  ORF Transcript_27229/g.59783 Transcript_27229/m.59783 type:complete len:131 (+) Transcript_27229:44-436(+)